MLSCVFFIFILAVSVGAEICNVTYDESGYTDATRTLYNCAYSMLDPKLPISNVKKYSKAHNLTIRTQFVLNNLISIDEIENVAELDFYWRMYWQDDRWVGFVWTHVMRLGSF